jgi:hypothetical protein
MGPFKMVTLPKTENGVWEILEEEIKTCDAGEAHSAYTDKMSIESRRKDLRIYRSNKDFEVDLNP